MPLPAPLSPPAPSPALSPPPVRGQAPVLVPWPPLAAMLAEGVGAVAAIPPLAPSPVDVVDGKSPGSCWILEKFGMRGQHQVPKAKILKFELG